MNPQLVLADVKIAGSPNNNVGNVGLNKKPHPLDLRLSGFSETIFTCLANVTNGGQLQLVSGSKLVTMKCDSIVRINTNRNSAKIQYDMSPIH